MSSYQGGLGPGAFVFHGVMIVDFFVQMPCNWQSALVINVIFGTSMNLS